MDHPGLPLEAFDLACVLDDSGRIRECARAPAQLRAALAGGVLAESVILETDREALRAALSRARESDEPQRFSARLGDSGSVGFFALRLLRDARSGELVLAGIELPQISGMPGADSLAKLEVMERVNASLVGAAGLEQALARKGTPLPPAE